MKNNTPSAPLRRSRHPLGFTLIELLVVISIIAILAAVLFPVFAQAKLAAKKAVDISNLKQISLAALMYSNDYDDQILPIFVSCDTPYPAGTFFCANYWFGQATYISSGLAINNSLGLVQPYMKNTAIQNSPNSPIDYFQAIWPSAQSDGKDTGLGYGYNGDLNAPADTGLTTTSLTEPSDTILLGDSAYALAAGQDGPGAPAANEVTTGLVVYPPSGQAYFNGIHGRYSGQGNVAWCDGHAKSKTPTPVPASIYNAAPGAAFFAANNVGQVFRPGASWGTYDQDYYYLADKTGMGG